jgi:hypothetical protein
MVSAPPSDHRLELVPVDRLGHRCAGVPDEIGDGLDRTPLSLMIAVPAGMRAGDEVSRLG